MIYIVEKLSRHFDEFVQQAVIGRDIQDVDSLIQLLKSEPYPKVNSDYPNSINTVFESLREYLLDEDEDASKLSNTSNIDCPQIHLLLEGSPVKALIDTGSKIT
ncbi:hypothetical protein TSAR_009408, partial [Trichomalopsis sarcophagae]